MRTTKLFIVIDEYKLETSKHEDGTIAKFETENQANDWACGRLEVWQVFKVHFQHEWIQHKI